MRIGPRSNSPSVPASITLAAILTKRSPFIAVVDDEAPVRKALARLLRSAGMSVDTFPSSAEFLESLEARQPDCLILDLHMRQGDGFAVLTRLAEAGNPLPIVVITGNDSAETRARAVAAGVPFYLCKPVDERALLEAISTAIATRALNQLVAPSPLGGTNSLNEFMKTVSPADSANYRPPLGLR